MGIKVDHQQGPAPLHRPQSGKNVAAGQVEQSARAGNLSGTNLQIGHGGGGVQPLATGQTGIPRPVLTPAREPSLIGYQSAMGVIDQVVNGWQSSTIVRELQQVGPPAHQLPGGPTPQAVTVFAGESGYSGVMDDQQFSVDMASKTMKLTADGKQFDIQLGEGGKLQHANADGVPVDLGEEEVKVLNDFFTLMALFHEMGVEQRQMSRQGRNMANEAVVQKIKSQADEQRSAAAAKFAAGCVSGAVKFASGALTMGGAVKGLKADQAAGGNGRVGDMIAQQYSAAGKMIEGIGEGAASALNYKAALHDATVTELRAEEERARFWKTTEQDQMQVGQELSTKARDAYAQTINQYLQTQSSIARNI